MVKKDKTDKIIPATSSDSISPRLARLLEAIEKTGSLNAASKLLGASYRYGWGQLKKANDIFGQPLIESKTGGEDGGHTTLTPFGKRLLIQHQLRTGAIEALTSSESFWQVVSTKLSARNQIPGKITSIKKDGVAARITIEVTLPVTITSMITSDAANFLELEEGMEVKAVIKATEVMVSV
jgi:molybdate transport system regulatory protein